jgi:hypothetical protein
MKRNPRWMMVLVLMILVIAADAPGWAGPLSSLQRLPNDPDTIGEPDGSNGSGKNAPASPGEYAIVPVGGGVWTIRLGPMNAVIQFLSPRARNTRLRRPSLHD